MAFKMKGSPMIKGTAKHKLALNKAMDQTSLPDGKAGSSAFQKLGSPAKQKEMMTKEKGNITGRMMTKELRRALTFDEAFAKARKEGKETFTWTNKEGKTGTYHTRTKEEEAAKSKTYKDTDLPEEKGAFRPKKSGSPVKQIIPAIITKALIDPSPKDFGDAFKQARKKGKQEFTWKGKKYHTKTKEEMEGGRQKGRTTREQEAPPTPKTGSPARLEGEEEGKKKFIGKVREKVKEKVKKTYQKVKGAVDVRKKKRQMKKIEKETNREWGPGEKKQWLTAYRKNRRLI
mgnify:CR=1 FL=1